MPHQVLETTPGMPSSAKVGTSGRSLSRVAWATASARSLPLARLDLSPVRSLTIMSTSPESSASVAGCPPLKGTTRRSAPVSCLKSSAAICTMVPGPEEAMVYLPGLAFAIATSSTALFAGRPSRTEDVRRVGDQPDEREVLPEIVGHLLHDQRVHHHGASRAEHEGVAVGRGACGRRRADAAACAVAVE